MKPHIKSMWVIDTYIICIFLSSFYFCYFRKRGLRFVIFELIAIILTLSLNIRPGLHIRQAPVSGLTFCIFSSNEAPLLFVVEVVWFGLYLSGFIHKQGTWYINICTRLNLSQTRSLHSCKRERPVVGMGVAKPAPAWCLLWFINQSLAPILALCLKFVNLRVSSGKVSQKRLLKLGWEPFLLRNWQAATYQCQIMKSYWLL